MKKFLFFRMRPKKKRPRPSVEEDPRKDETFDMIFDDDYPAGVETCSHGPLVKFKSTKRVANSNIPKISYSYRCSFNRSGECGPLFKKSVKVEPGESSGKARNYTCKTFSNS